MKKEMNDNSNKVSVDELDIDQAERMLADAPVLRILEDEEIASVFGGAREAL